MRARSRARGWALQLLYAWEARDRQPALSAALESFSAERTISPANLEYLERLIDTISGHAGEIDRALETSLTNWRMERLSTIDRNILRVGAAEILFLDDVPPRVSIQEAIVLAEKYGTRESPRFVNGVLDALMRRHDEAGVRDGDGP
ncbi:MAG: transcription antitermination factor NusB [Longimicrobiales bacterium]